MKINTQAELLVEPTADTPESNGKQKTTKLNIKPNRNELLDALARQFYQGALAQIDVLDDEISKLVDDICELQQEIADTRLGMHRFEDLQKELEEAVNTVLTKYRQPTTTVQIKGGISEETVEGDDVKYYVKPQIYVNTIYDGRKVRAYKTTLLDRKLEQMKAERAEKESERQAFRDQTAGKNPDNATPQQKKQLRDAVMRRLIDTDGDLLGNIKEAAKKMAKGTPAEAFIGLPFKAETRLLT